jgi:hypothetical protein
VRKTPTATFFLLLPYAINGARTENRITANADVMEKTAISVGFHSQKKLL